MLEENEVDLADRILCLEGSVSDRIFNSVKAGLPFGCKAAECYFVTFSYADLPLPKQFEVIFMLAQPDQADIAPVVIKAVTQQFSRAWDSVPHGWKTICWLENATSHSKILRAMPQVDGWYVKAPTIGLASRDTWSAFKRKRAAE